MTKANSLRAPCKLSILGLQHMGRTDVWEVSLPTTFSRSTGPLRAKEQEAKNSPLVHGSLTKAKMGSAD